jgi:hypothetical protein
MRRMMTLTVCSLIGCLAGPLCAQQPVRKEGGPCEQVVQACKSAGFIAGDAREGNGLWADCVGPIMRGTGQPPKATIALPQVSADVVAACKAKRPNFGEGKGPPPKSGQPAPPSGQPDQPSGK